MNSHTLFLLLPFFILVKPSLPLSVASPLELLSLLTIKANLIDPLNSFSDWDTSTLPRWCSWSGVKCDSRTDHVTSLDLSGRNLSGTIPTEIKHLSQLNHLNLSKNAFDGPLQTIVFELLNLTTLDISRNLFSSSFPPSISKLESLTFFNAYSNSFTGALPEEVINLRNLEYLNLGGSYFEGEIPSSYTRFSMLKSLYLQGNSLNGSIPDELGLLNQLEHVELGYNAFIGRIPVGLSNCSNLVYLDISSANLSGNLPAEFGLLGKLEILLLFKNNLSGSIPVIWGEMESLRTLDLSDNNLSGEIPDEFKDLKELNILSLMNNKLNGEIPQALGVLPKLEVLNLWNNSFSGSLPQKLGLNSKLQKLDVSTNSISGVIPPNLCFGNRLMKLILFSNQFVGEIPESLVNCTSLIRLRIQNNYLNGSIPLGFGNLPNLTYLEMSKNRLSGRIPRDLGDAVKLEFLNVSDNRFATALPDNIWNSPNLQIFSASSSYLNGKIPNFTGCRSVYKIELDGNNLTDSIPWDISHCEKLISLKLEHNSLTGIIPWEISALPSITDVDLSHNLLTGTIPSSFNNCTTLENFNVSCNHLTGSLPSSGVLFPNLHPSSFAGNEGLCGEIIKKPCRAKAYGNGIGIDNRHEQPKNTAGLVVWIIAAAIVVGLFILIAGNRFFRIHKFTVNQDGGPWKLTAFQRLNFTADDVLACLNLTDQIIGMGSTGTVYKAKMPGGEIVAVKKLWAMQKDTNTSKKDVLVEVDVLGNVRHRNIVRLLGYCSNNQCTMLLYDYMPNGSLDDLLHGKNKDQYLVSDWVTRYKIALGVAQGICYLHHDCDPPIVHRDLKPRNILLDAEMEARVADFGVAKLIHANELMSVIAGSYGYIAPEYAYTLQVDKKSDIYSYGVVLMELLTGKKSVDAEFGDENNIVDWLKSKIKTKSCLVDVLDKSVGASCAFVREEMSLVFRIALLCTSRNPADRPSMRDVVSMLEEAKPVRKLHENARGEW